jgi:transcriptional regulator with XRE-family HTH domain
MKTRRINNMYNNVYFKNKRLALGLTTREVAEMAGVSQTTVSNFESAENSIKVSEPFKKAIQAVLNAEMHNLPKNRFLEAKLIENVLNATENSTRPEEKLDLLISAINNASKMAIELRESIKDAKREAFVRREAIR